MAIPVPVDGENEYPVTLSLAALFYNEEASAEQVIREAHAVLRRTGETFEIVAIQNGSRDCTPMILRRLSTELKELRILVIPVNKGAGYGARMGWYDCRGRYAAGVSGDGQVDLQALPQMFDLMRQTGSELAYGKRRTRKDGSHRAAISWLYRNLMRAVFGIESRDMNGCPKILTNQALRAMAIVSDDHFFECEMVMKAARMGLRICGMDVDFHVRKGGKSAVGWSDILDYLDHLARVGLGVGDRWNVNGVPRWRSKPEWLYFADGKPRTQDIRPELQTVSREGM